MSRAGNYLLGLIPSGRTGKQFFQTYTLTHVDEAILQKAVSEDSVLYAYNALVSFLAGLSALNKRHAAWCVTEMYYSAFYIARASLSRDRKAIFHVPKGGGAGHTQFEIDTYAGRAASVSTIPSTHKLVARRFRERGYPSFMGALVIDGLDPIDWLMEQREYWQYRASRFPDPELPTILKHFDDRKPQTLLCAYDSDQSGIYLADPEHALVALPFRLVSWFISGTPLVNSGLIQPDDLRYLRRSCMAGTTLLTAISRYLSAD